MAGDSRCAAIINCGQLVTLAGPSRPRIRDELKNLAILPNGAMTIRDRLIEAVGSYSEIQSRITPEYEIIDARGRVVLPGFVDAHTHAVFAGTRADEYELRATGATYEQIAEQGGGIRSTVRKTRAASEDELFQTAQRYRQWFLRNGTTTLEAKSGYGLSLEHELKLLRVINRLGYVPTFLGAHEIPDEYRENTAEYVRLVTEDMLPAVARARLAEYCDVFCEPKVFDISAARKILSVATILGFKLRVHADQLSSSGAAQLAAQLRAQTADHLEYLDDAGLFALARAHVQPVLLPASVQLLGSRRFAPARAIIDVGLAIVLATDFNPGSSPTPSMPFVLSLASTHMHMTPAEALTAATINAAYSLDRGAQIGSLEPGKRADFVIHDCRDYREIAYFAGIESPDSVYIAGELAFSRSAQSSCN
jgi:imidazolonepropionase